MDAADKKKKKDASSRGKVKLTYAERLEYEKIDRVIADLEKALHLKEDEISRSACDYVALQQLNEEKTELEEQLEFQMERWLYLQELAEKQGG